MKHFIGLLGLSLLLSFAAAESGCDQHVVVGVGYGGGGGVGPGSGIGGNDGTCPGSHGPPMARIPVPGGSSYCIDKTEVTQAEYDAFLQASPQTDTSSALCSYKTTFVPGHEPSDVNMMEPSPTECGPHYNLFDPAGTPDLPVVCVDWCDAAAYCAWAGKRLCGRIGGGAAPYAEYDDPAHDEWYRACSNAGASQFPYGASFVQGTCSDGATAQPVGSASACHGTGAPFDQIFDMSGNVAEWENDCMVIDPGEGGAGGGKPSCTIRGGSVTNLESDPITQQRFGCTPLDGGRFFDDYNFERPHTGIRCCAD